MSKRILYCATVDYHFKAFHLPYMKWFKEQGWDVDVAAAGKLNLPYTDKKYDIPIKRSPFHKGNIEAYKRLRDIIDQNNYRIIHCHTPLGGVISRLAAKHARKKGTKVIYTVHGFHFCKGAPLKNWFIYYPIEKYLSRFTDSLITINEEDQLLAKRHRFKAENIEQVHGVGVDTGRFKPLNNEQKKQLKQSFGYKPDDFLLFYAAEFNKNKNQPFLIRVMAQLKNQVPHAKLLLAGEGEMLENCRELAQRLEVAQMVDFLGFRKDIDQLLPVCDAAVASSYREGLPVNVMEAMACGLPIVALENRGHRELVVNNKNGWILDGQDIEAFSKKILLLATSPDMCKQFGSKGREMIVSTYSTGKVLSELQFIYRSFMEEGERTIWAVH